MEGSSYALRDDRLFLLFPRELDFDVRYIEGSRWHNDLKVWSGPASWRYIQALDTLGFVPRNEDTGLYREWLQELAIEGLSSYNPPTLEVAGKTLFPFQGQGYMFLSHRDTALLYDEQGVGKTLQALKWAEQDPRTLVTCPKTVIDQWASLIETMGKKVVVQPEGLLPWDTWGVTNYERLDRLEFHKGLTLIVDECHFIKNLKTKRSKLVLDHGKAAARILAVSGTPMVNRPEELWSIYELLRQRKRNERWGFLQRYCGAHQDDWGHWDFSGATHLDELKDDMLHFALRRTKAEVLKDLPPKRYTTLKVSVSKGEQSEIHQRDREIFELLGQGYGAYSNESLGALQRLRVHSANAKVAGLEEYLRNHYESGGGPVVIFGGFKEALYRIADTFDGGMYTGDQSDAERKRAKSAFISGESNLIALTFGAGGVGLDGLQTVSDTVILLDLPWTPSETAQAEDRLHRQGQLGSVNVISVWSGSKVEELILRARDKKMDVLSYLMEM